MLGKLSSVFTALVFATTTAASPPVVREAGVGSAGVRQVAQLSKPSWIENIAVRPNGQLLACRFDVAELYLVNQFTGDYSVVASFPGVEGAWGIAEYKPDVYAVIVGNFTLANRTSIRGTFSIRTVDLSKGLGRDGKVTPKLLANFSEANNLNGLTFAAPNTLYASNSEEGKVYEINAQTGASKVAIANEPLFTPNADFPLGINGIRWSDKERSLFFSNSGQNIVGVVPQKRDGSFASARKIASNPDGPPSQSLYDDFALDAENNFYAATNPGNTVNFISRDGKRQYIIAGNKNSTQIAGPTSVQFGRTRADKNVAYVVTNGGFAAPINGTTVVGAQIIAITLRN